MWCSNYEPESSRKGVLGFHTANERIHGIGDFLYQNAPKRVLFAHVKE